MIEYLSITAPDGCGPAILKERIAAFDIRALCMGRYRYRSSRRPASYTGGNSNRDFLLARRPVGRRQRFPLIMKIRPEDLRGFGV
jgi:hypothetical protein